MVKRAVTTLVARGGGSYVTKDPLAHPIIPDYVATVLPLLCSFARLTATSVPQLQFVALTHNLTTDELAHLRSNRAITMEVAAIAPAIVGLPMRAARQDCLLRSNFSWAAHGRSDIASTMLKLAVWRLPYDEVLYVDSDAIFLRNPISLFELLGGSSPTLQSKAAPRAMQANCATLLRMNPHNNGSKLLNRPLCNRLTFVAPFSGRLSVAERFDRHRPECRVAGWQSGIFLTRPSERIFRSLMHRAREADYSSFTRSEQDLLDRHFDPLEQCLLGRATSTQLHDVSASNCAAHGAIRRDSAYRTIFHHKIHAFADAAHSPVTNIRKGYNDVLASAAAQLCADHSAPLDANATRSLMSMIDDAERRVFRMRRETQSHTNGQPSGTP